MLDIKTKSGGFASSSIDWGKLLKVLIAVLTALAGAIGVASCTA